MTSDADKLVDELRSDGVEVARGMFTLDREKAREKLRDFQLADPKRFLLLLVQVAVLKGASRLDCSVSATSAVLNFDGRIFTHEELAKLYDNPFASDLDKDGQALQKLALGTNVGLGRNLSSISVRSGNERGGSLLELRPGQSDVLRRVDAIDGSAGTRIELRYSGLFAGLYRRWLSLLRCQADARLLRDCCRYADTAITVNGDRVSNGLQLPLSWNRVPMKGEGWRGEAGQTARQAEGTVVLVVRHGVWICSIIENDSHQYRVAVVDDKALRTDLSHFALVRDEAYDRMMKRVSEAVEQVGLGNDKPIPEHEAPERIFPTDSDIVPSKKMVADAWVALISSLFAQTMLFGSFAAKHRIHVAEQLGISLVCTVFALIFTTRAALRIRKSRGKWGGVNATLVSLLSAVLVIGVCIAFLPDVVAYFRKWLTIFAGK